LLLSVAFGYDVCEEAKQHGCAQFCTGSYKYALDCLQSDGV